MTALTVPAFLILTFLNTGAVQKYAFDSVQNCEAMRPAVIQLYKDLGNKVTVECKARKDIEPPANAPSVEVKHKVMIKESYKIRASYKL